MRTHPIVETVVKGECFSADELPAVPDAACKPPLPQGTLLDDRESD